MFVFKDINKPAVIEQNVVNYTQNLSTSSAGITTTKIISGSSNTKYWDSLNELRQTTMKGNPTTFISQVQLYNTAGEMVAVGNLSTPLKKNFSSEATIKVKLTY